MLVAVHAGGSVVQALMVQALVTAYAVLESREEDDSNCVIRPMQIFVKTLTGRTITLNVAGTDRIELIREMIWDSEQVLPCQQRLLYGCKQLEDGKDLGDYSVLGESTVYLVLRLCGGGIWPAPGSAQGYGCVDASEKCADDGMSAI